MRQCVFGATTARLDLVGGRLFGDRDVDVRQQVFALAARLRLDRRQIVVDLGIGHQNLAVDFAIAQPLHHDLPADVLAIVGVRDVLLFEHFAKLVWR